MEAAATKWEQIGLSCLSLAATIFSFTLRYLIAIGVDIESRAANS